MNVEKVNRYVITRGLHRLDLGKTIWSAIDAITGELGADFTAILRQLDCSLLGLADAAMDARDAIQAARDARNAAQDDAWDPDRDPARGAAWDPAWEAARNAAQDTPPR